MLTDAWTQLRPHREQSFLWRTKKRFVAAACGRGSGKTELARRRIVRYLAVRKPWPDPIYFYALPTYAQAKRVAWRPLKALIPPDWIRSESASELVIETKFGSRLYVVGMDKPERIEGVQWDGGVLDESCDQKPGAFARSVVPALEHRNAWCWRIGVPKRYGVGAEEFREFFERGLKMPGSGIHSAQWASDTVLSEEQLEWAQENLDPLDYDEQYRALWQKVGGTVFFAFDPDVNVRGDLPYDRTRQLIIGSDFNVDPMAWVVGHAYDNELHVLDEIFVRNTNTPAVLKLLAEKYQNHVGGFAFYGDATGQARKTSASMSDYMHIRQSDLFPRASVHYPRSNPRVADRFAATNTLLCNAKGERRLFIHKRCRNLVHDLKYRRYKEGTREPDDYGDLGHITDALGYVIVRLFPLKLVPHTAPSVVTISRS